MSLIKCNECGKEISDKAVSCPNCGFPLQENFINLDKSRELNVNIKKYELTNKKWKAKLIISISLVILGLISFIISIFLDNSLVSIFWTVASFLFMVVGGILFFVAAIGHWWERG